MATKGRRAEGRLQADRPGRGHDDQQVFVKMTGPKAAVEQQAAAFDQFAGSLRVKQEARRARGAPPHGAGGPPDARQRGKQSSTTRRRTGWTKQKPDSIGS